MRDNPSRFKINIQNLFQVSGIIAISRDQYGTFLEIWPQKQTICPRIPAFHVRCTIVYFYTILLYT